MRWIFTLGFVVCATAWAATSYRVNSGNTTQVDEHGTCQNVINGSVFDVLVPTNTSTEWSMFRTSPPTSVTFSSCGASCTSGAITYTSKGAGTFTMPANCNIASVKAWGGGGGGGNNTASAGKGGGAGYATRDISVAPAGTITFTVASGGAAGACSATTVTGGPGGYAGGKGGISVVGYSGAGALTGGTPGTGTSAGGQGYYGGGGGGGQNGNATNRGGGGGGATTAVDTYYGVTFLIAGGGGGGGGASAATGGAGGPGCWGSGSNASGARGGGGSGGACSGYTTTTGSGTTAGNSSGAVAGVGNGGKSNGTCAGTGDGASGEVIIEYSYGSPTLSVNDVIATEGYSLIFLVSVSSFPVTSNVTFNYSTVDGTATSGTDYTGSSGSATIATGSRALNITILTNTRSGDNGTRAMSITFTSLSGATAGDTSGAGTIYDDTTCTSGAMTLSANGSFTLPTACTSLTIEAWGAGGGSGPDLSGTSKTGGAGGYAKKTYTAAVPGTVYTGVIGVGGLCLQTGGSGAFSGGTGGNSNACTGGGVGSGGGSGGSGGTKAGAGCVGGAGKYGGAGGGGGAQSTASGGGGGGATGVSVSGVYIVIAGGGGGAGAADQGTAGAGGPGCSVNGGNASGGDAAGGGGGGACYCEGTGCTQTASGTVGASPADPGVAAPTSGRARGGPLPAANCIGTTNDGTDGMIRFTYGP